MTEQARRICGLVLGSHKGSGLSSLNCSDEVFVTDKSVFFYQLTDKGMGHLGDKCKNLKTIDISGCITLTDEGILQLTQVSYSKGMSTVNTGMLFLFKGVL